MSLLSLTVNLLVADVSATARFYTDVLGFEMTIGVIEGTEDTVFEAVDEPLQFVILKRDDVEIMVQSQGSMDEDLPGYRPSEGGDAVSLYIDVEDVEALWDELKERVDVVKELATTFYGAKEFHFRDPNGFLIGFAERPRRH